MSAALVTLAAQLAGCSTTRGTGAGEGMMAEATPTIDEALADELRRDVVRLAGEIGERNVWLPGKLAAAADYIDAQLQAAGYETERQLFEAEGLKVCNIVATCLGTERPERVLVVGAHYDSRCGIKHRHGRRRVPGMPGTPGANDNASGIAAMLALARRFAQEPAPITVRFVAFVNEEPPFFCTPLMGSRVYARACRERGDDVIGMLSLDTLGCYSDEPGSQSWSLLLGRPLWTRANFVAFMSNWGSASFARRTAEAFRARSDVRAVSVCVPRVVPRVAWSDDSAFWEEGYPALTVTDTAYLRSPNYHTVNDTPDTLNYPAMARVVDALGLVVRDLAGSALSR